MISCRRRGRCRCVKPLLREQIMVQKFLRKKHFSKVQLAELHQISPSVKRASDCRYKELCVGLIPVDPQAMCHSSSVMYIFTFLFQKRL